jgi:undecaprenyl-diphosphatase
LSNWLALLLGLVQGLTEFLPVSSSGHLKLFQLLFGLESVEQYVRFDLVCHGGTLLAILVVLRREILGLSRSMALMIILGTIPLGFAILLKKQLLGLYGATHLLGFWFLLTALLLWVGEKWRPRAPGRRVGALGVGFAQLLAILPGVSRSGATISAGRVLGLERVEAARFAFLLAIPAIAGGMLIEGISTGGTTLPLTSYLIGFVTSFAIGALALVGLLKLIQRFNLLPFAWYTLVLGLVCLIVTIL